MGNDGPNILPDECNLFVKLTNSEKKNKKTCWVHGKEVS